MSLSAAAAQTATLRGRVLDESGSSIPGATISVTGAGALVRSATAAGDGQYTVGGLAPGDYAVSANAPQLATPKPVRIALQPGTTTLDLRLRIVTRREEVTVQDTGLPSVGVDSASNAGAIVIQGKDLDALADDPNDLQADLQALAGPAAGPSGGSIFIDGFSGGQLPPKESIREIRINQNPFAPEFDKLGYGRIEIFTKPGASKWKGTLGYNFADDAWNSRNPFAAHKAPLRLQEFENSVGGPLGKRASFTLDLERHMVDNGFIANGIELDPVTHNPVPFDTTLKSLQRRTMVSPRADYQLTTQDTVTARFTFTNSDVHGAGVGGFDDPSRAYRLHNRFHTVQLSNTLVLGRTINETRFQYYRWERKTEPEYGTPAIQVLGAFTSGGASVGRGIDTQNNYEWQNNTTLPRGKHIWRAGFRLRDGRDDSSARTNFNGTYTFTSIDTYRGTILGLPGDLPSQFSITTGNPELRARQWDAGVFVGDEWRLRPNLTLHYGMRYEVQTNIGDRKDLAPRFSLAWAPGRSRSGRTVLRAGSGMFYDRFALANTMTARRFDGVTQQQYVVTSPSWFPALPPMAQLGAARAQQVVERVDANLRAPYILQSAVTVERQLTRSTTASATFTNSHGLHMLRSLAVPGTAPVFLMTSSGLYNQNQLIANLSTKPLPQVSLFGYYVFNRARSNSDSLNTFPANPRDYAGEYGPASTDIHHRMLAGGSLGTRWNLRLSPYLMAQSGAPFDITTGLDRYGTTLLNSRPGIATSLAPGVIVTSYGLLDPNPLPGQRILPRNYGRGPGQITLNLRVGKTIGLGPLKGGGKVSGGAPNIDAANMAAPGGLRGLFAPPSSDRRYSLTIQMSGRNLLNHVNSGPIVGNITSPLFGRANQIATTPNGEGFSENASNRRLELQIKLAF